MDGESSSELPARVQELIVLYTRTKQYVLLAEEKDPDCRSRISIFKEQRDAFDHLMRAMTRHCRSTMPGEWTAQLHAKALADETQPRSATDESYINTQIDKARGHLFRAAYDALDSMGISFKARIYKAVEGASNEAISAAFKEYWDHLAQVNKLDASIARHREQKDVGTDHTLANLETYAGDVNVLAVISEEAESRISGLVEYGKKQKANDRKWKIIIPASLVIISIIITTFVTLVVKPWLEERSSNAPATEDKPTASASPNTALLKTVSAPAAFTTASRTSLPGRSSIRGLPPVSATASIRR